jgi:hypothetical protein
MSRLVWFSLVDQQGNDIVQLDAETIPSESFVVHFRKVVWNKTPQISSISAGNLSVYLNKASYEAKENPLKASQPISGLETSEDDPLYVVVDIPVIK